jgi:hypothetical protein
VKDVSPLVLKDLQKQIEKKLREQEISVLEYWRERLDKIAALRPDGIASLQLEIKKVSDMMANRVKILKQESAK